MTTVHPASAMVPSSPAVVHTSPWHTPVPYFFGGLAAVMGLIAFALLVLACTYIKPGEDVVGDGAGEIDLEAGDDKHDNRKDKFTVFEEKYLVIMAGDANPTFLATPITNGASSCGSCGCRSTLTEESSSEKVKQESSDQLQVRNTENQETPDRLQ